MYNCLGFAVWIVLASAANGVGAEYLLKIEDVEGPVPQIERPEGAPPMEVGWLPVAAADSEPIRIARRIEILVSTATEFHLRVRDRGELIELKGKLQKSKGVSAQVTKVFAGRQQPPTITGEQGQDFVVNVEYGRVLQDGRRATMRTAIPIRFGKRFCLGGGLNSFPPTLWSLEKIKTEPRED